MSKARTVAQGNESALGTMAVASTKRFVGPPGPGHWRAQYLWWRQGTRQRVEIVVPL